MFFNAEGPELVIAKPSAKLFFDELGGVVTAEAIKGSMLIDEPAHDLTGPQGR